MVFDPNLDLVPQPPTSNLPQVNFDAAPVFDATPPDLPNRTPPGPLTATPPAGPPALDPVSVPDAPDVVLPDFPSLREIDLPSPPTVTLPTFAGVRPSYRRYEVEATVYQSRVQAWASLNTGKIDQQRMRIYSSHSLRPVLSHLESGEAHLAGDAPLDH